jgi:hypothetical protein
MSQKKKKSLFLLSNTQATGTRVDLTKEPFNQRAGKKQGTHFIKRESSRCLATIMTNLSASES